MNATKYTKIIRNNPTTDTRTFDSLATRPIANSGIYDSVIIMIVT